MMWKGGQKVNWFILVLYAAILFSGSCTKKPDPVPSYIFASEGVQVRYTADKRLNLYDNRAHTLMLVIYQLDNVNAFNKLSSDRGGLKQLLKAKSFDASVMAVEKRFIEPGVSDKIILNRAEKAKWVGFVGGFYNLETGKVSKTFEIPHAIKSKGFIRKKHYSEIEPLFVKLFLGPQSMQEIKDK